MHVGAPKGKKHRVFSQEEKIGYIEAFLSRINQAASTPKILDWTMDVFAGGSKLITKRGGTVWHHIEIGVEIDMPLYIPVTIWMNLDSFNFGWQR